MSNKTTSRIRIPKERNLKVYQPRNNWVLIRQVRIDLTEGGIALSDNASEAYKHVIEAKGSKVEELEVGDEVQALLIAQPPEAQNFIPVPGEKLLIATKEVNVILVIKRSES